MQKKRFSRLFPALFLAVDLLFLNLGFVIANYIRFNTFWFEGDKYPFLFGFLNVAWVVIFFATRLEKVEREKSVVDYISQILLALTINLAVVFAMWASTRAYFYSREHLFYTYLIFSILVVGWRVGFIYVLRYFRAKGYNYRNVVIVGYGPIGRSLKRHFLQTPELGYAFKGFFDHKSDHPSVSGKVEEVYQYCVDKGIDTIFCCLPKLYDEDVKNLVDFAENNLIRIKLLSDFSRISNMRLQVQKYGNIPVLDVNSIPLDKMLNRLAKRVFDLVFASVVAIFILSWLFPIVALLIKLDSKGPVFFRQYRNGIMNQKFLIWKFRSMYVHDDQKVIQAKKNDSRITKVGAFLRKTSLDELPQFINVFTGEMSIVGPRPHAVQHNEEYKPKIDRFIQRHAVKPGLTGLAQAKGYRGETSRFSEMYGRVKLDRFYVKNWSLWFDVKIIVLTVYSIVFETDKAY